MKRLLVLSDLHLAAPSELCNFSAGNALCELLEAATAAGRRFVFAGDTFDLLQVPGRAEVLDLEGAPELLRRVLADVRRQNWGARFFHALRAVVEAGGECILLPGNHDPELFHPLADDILCAAVGL